jgi:tetratricopeptide (TPR) repeat protein
VRKPSNSEWLLSGQRRRRANEPKPKREHATLPSSAKAIQNLRPATRTGPSPITTRRFDSKSTLAFIGRGDAYSNKGDHDRALADYNEAIRLDPKSALALSDRGVAYGNKGDYDRALADLNEAIRLDPKSAHAFRNRGVLYAHKGDNDRAIADFNETIRLDPNNALAFCNRGRAKRNINDASGNADIAKARQLDPSVCR